MLALIILSGLFAGLAPRHGRAWERLSNAATLLTIVGIGIAVLGVILALVFDRGNLRALLEATTDIKSHISDTFEQYVPKDPARADETVAGDPEEQLAKQPAWAEPDPLAPHFVIKQPSGREVAVYGLSAVPMRVVADLVEYWRKQGRTGKRLLGQLEFAVRARGKGNHPWLLKFEEEPAMWRVSYGGRGMDGEKATVRQLDQPPESDHATGEH